MDRRPLRRHHHLLPSRLPQLPLSLRLLPLLHLLLRR